MKGGPPSPRRGLPAGRRDPQRRAGSVCLKGRGLVGVISQIHSVEVGPVSVVVLERGQANASDLAVLENVALKAERPRPNRLEIVRMIDQVHPRDAARGGVGAPAA